MNRNNFFKLHECTQYKDKIDRLYIYNKNIIRMYFKLYIP